ncbi:MAG: ATP-binding protein [Pseudomonadota bacterium]
MPVHRLKDLKGNQEYQSGLVRFVLWTVAVGFINAAHFNGYYDFDYTAAMIAAFAILGMFAGIFASIFWVPRSPWRPYLSIVGDIAANTTAIVFLQDPLSPFFLIYLWISISAGARFGKQALLIATFLGALVYAILLTAFGAWEYSTFDAVFQLMLLGILPMYLQSLLDQLRNLQLAAESANRARGAFIATVSHELRTPLNGVAGMAWLLSKTRLDNEQREYTKSIISATDTLKSLIGDVLDLSKIDASRMDLERQLFDPASVMVDVCRALSPQWQEKKLEVVCDTALDLPRRVWGDELRFRQIVLNLVGNAIKFTERGSITVRARVMPPVDEVPGTHLLVEIIDTGIGIPPDKQAQIFKPFVQADSSTRRRYGGSGLGTAIAGELTRLMGGAIGVRSHEGRGSTFWVRLPLTFEGQTARAGEKLAGRTFAVSVPGDRQFRVLALACRRTGINVRRTDTLPLKESQGVDALVIQWPEGESLASVEEAHGSVPALVLRAPGTSVTLPSHWQALAVPFSPFQFVAALEAVIPGLADTAQVPTAGRARTAGEAPAVTGLSILVAEDDAINARLISRLLERAGHSVELAKDGRIALEAARGQVFDLALVDMRMPVMDGLDFVRSYRREESGHRHLPMIMVTADVTADAREQCLAAGADDVLAKPIDPDRLDGLLRDIGAQGFPREGGVTSQRAGGTE